MSPAAARPHRCGRPAPSFRSARDASGLPRVCLRFGCRLHLRCTAPLLGPAGQICMTSDAPQPPTPVWCMSVLSNGASGAPARWTMTFWGPRLRRHQRCSRMWMFSLHGRHKAIAFLVWQLRTRRH
ncbi:uncharacterized protein TRAVEDRAFT_72107 [Trametes versicolor FP-101664 SS1]|uniref:uncharacterized protein n=1 Tax=Trametes versicolor (strain FP-101664) TaxID=717944 RepID=UPI0004624504|nr:uncharacterized protein TRAVEDRAFT_72107 [Trametes versicolor FP-101664 SS1]EIW58586.1 hypothetical protein TRAVEDRAFT_72107 [Trametes versicolor FP-101664 SS1]